MSSVVQIDSQDRFIGHYPALRRARGYHLYLAHGQRLLDLYQDDGRAFLGHNPSGLGRVLKAEIDRALYVPSKARRPAAVQQQFQRLCRRLDSCAPEMRLGKGTLLMLDPRCIAQCSTLDTWRPGLPAPNTERLCELRLPLPGAWSAIPVLIPQGNAVEVEAEPAPLYAAGLAHVLAALVKDPRLAGTRICTDAHESAWRKLNTPLFSRCGAYLKPHVRVEHYGEFHAQMQQRGYFLHPNSGGTSIIPANCSDGEFKGFLRACNDLKEFADAK